MTDHEAHEAPVRRARRRAVTGRPRTTVEVVSRVTLASSGAGLQRCIAILSRPGDRPTVAISLEGPGGDRRLAMYLRDDTWLAVERAAEIATGPGLRADYETGRSGTIGIGATCGGSVRIGFDPRPDGTGGRGAFFRGPELEALLRAVARARALYAATAAA